LIIIGSPSLIHDNGASDEMEQLGWIKVDLTNKSVKSFPSLVMGGGKSWYS
jgi:hypothetical protein